ncbi:hypothetical protein L1049_012724 [Liquidambar formosana]|uniref:Uncharacterized protein n=1 Tax=Liquidambar formosana TaxID=63359 RepID=A0AAP0RLE2_LIQFO
MKEICEREQVDAWREFELKATLLVFVHHHSLVNSIVTESFLLMLSSESSVRLQPRPSS